MGDYFQASTPFQMPVSNRYVGRYPQLSAIRGGLIFPNSKKPAACLTAIAKAGIVQPVTMLIRKMPQLYTIDEALVTSPSYSIQAVNKGAVSAAVIVWWRLEMSADSPFGGVSS